MFICTDALTRYIVLDTGSEVKTSSSTLKSKKTHWEILVLYLLQGFHQGLQRFESMASLLAVNIFSILPAWNLTRHNFIVHI